MQKKKTYLVSDFMHKNVVALDVTATFADAVRIMVEHNTNGVVVVDQSKKVAGILSSWDLIEHLVPDYLENDKHLATFESAAVFEERIFEVAQDPITKFMSKVVYTVHPNHSLMAAATLLSEFKIRQLPVVDEKGNLVGYLNRTDIKQVIAQVLGLKD